MPALRARRFAAGSPHSGSSKIALAWGVSTSLTIALNSSIMAELISAPFSLASDFCSDPRWSMAAAAITPRWLETAFIPASFPGVRFIVIPPYDFGFAIMAARESPAQTEDLDALCAAVFAGEPTVQPIVLNLRVRTLLQQRQFLENSALP